MSEIEMPFNDWSTERLRDGRKTATSRYKKHGKTGDVFYNKSRSMCFELDEIVLKTLHDIATYHFKEEGARSPIDFISLWVKIYPYKGFVPKHKVFYHTFKRIH